MRKKILFVVCTHGDEQVGRSLLRENPQGFNEAFEWQVIVGNPKAMELGVRYVHTDLNRSYNVQGQYESYEVNRMHELEKVIKKYDVVYDIHQTTPGYAMPDCIFVNELSDEVKKAIEPCLAKYVILDDDPKYSGHFVTTPAKVGITLEYGRTGTYSEEVDRLETDVQRILGYQGTPPTEKIFLRSIKPVPLDKSFINAKDFVPLTPYQKGALGLDLKKTYYPTFVNQYPDMYFFLTEEL